MSDEGWVPNRQSDTEPRLVTVDRAEIAAFRAENARLREALEKLRRRHVIDYNDSWYSCPKSGDCDREGHNGECDCGADDYNTIIDAALAPREPEPKEES